MARKTRPINSGGKTAWVETVNEDGEEEKKRVTWCTVKKLCGRNERVRKKCNHNDYCGLN